MFFGIWLWDVAGQKLQVPCWEDMKTVTTRTAKVFVLRCFEVLGVFTGVFTGGFYPW